MPSRSALPALPSDPAPEFSLYHSSKYIALSCGEPILCGRGPAHPMCDPPPKVSLYQCLSLPPLNMSDILVENLYYAVSRTTPPGPTDSLVLPARPHSNDMNHTLVRQYELRFSIYSFFISSGTHNTHILLKYAYIL